jgi:hypothetical protein
MAAPSYSIEPPVSSIAQTAAAVLSRPPPQC